MSRLMTLLLAGLLLVKTAEISRAGVVEDCNGARSLDQQIRACSVLIDDDTLSVGNRAIAYGNRGNAYGMQRRWKEALADYETAIGLDPTDPLTFYNRGNVLFDLGRLREAERDYGEAISLNEAFALAHYNRGLVREKLGDLTGATSDYKIAEALDDPIAAKAKARRQRLEATPPARKGGTGTK